MKLLIIASTVFVSTGLAMEKKSSDNNPPIEYVQGYTKTIKRLLAREESNPNYTPLEKEIIAKKAQLQKLKDDFDENHATVFEKLDYLQRVNTVGHEVTILQKRYLFWRQEISVLKNILLNNLKKQNQLSRSLTHK